VVKPAGAAAAFVSDAEPRKAVGRGGRLDNIISSLVILLLPRFEAAHHGVDVFVAHSLEALSRERGAAAAAAMGDDGLV
jgi:hypothetical protein